MDPFSSFMRYSFSSCESFLCWAQSSLESASSSSMSAGISRHSMNFAGAIPCITLRYQDSLLDTFGSRHTITASGRIEAAEPRKGTIFSTYTSQHGALYFAGEFGEAVRAHTVLRQFSQRVRTLLVQGGICTPTSQAARSASEFGAADFTL